MTIDRVNRDFGELKTLLKLAISGPHAPDVVEANQGWPDMGQLVKAGLLLPLDNYAKAYGWDEKVSENVRAVSTWSPDGKEFGTGDLFGYTTMGEIVGVYYNKQMLADLGLTIPTTFGEFEQDLEVATQAGEVPIQFGNNDAFPGIHEYAVIQDQMASTSYLTDFIFGRKRNELSFDTPENVQAATTLQDWAQKGYFTPGFGGGGYDNAVANFGDGQGLFMITGNWIVANLGADNRNFGFFPLPPMTAGAPAGLDGRRGLPPGHHGGVRAPRRGRRLHRLDEQRPRERPAVQAGQIPLRAGRSELVDRAGHGAGRRGRRGVGRVEGQRRRSLRGLGHTDLLRHPHRGDPGADGHADHAAGVRGAGREGLRRLPERRGRDGRAAGRRLQSRRGREPPGRAPGRSPRRAPARARRGGSATSTSRRRSSCTPRSTSGRSSRARTTRSSTGTASRSARGSGLGNYKEFFTDPDIRVGYLHVLILMFFYAFMPIVIGLFLAAVLSRIRIRGLTVFRLLLFLPLVITDVATAVAWIWVYDVNGPLNTALRSVGLGRLDPVRGLARRLQHRAAGRRRVRDVGDVRLLPDPVPGGRHEDPGEPVRSGARRRGERRSGSSSP